jgi:hypothetical protein
MYRRAFGLLVCASQLIGDLTFAAEPAPPTGVVRRLDVFPRQITLAGPRAEERVGVLGLYADGRQWDLSRTTRFTSDNPAVATVDAAGIVRPAGDGTATVTATSGGATADIRVTVSAFKSDELINFTRDVETVITKAGCNQGACHGAAIGRGGFRLSLRGFDPAFDHSQIVQSAEGRRVVLGQPERSILLLKPSLAMEHGGGERLKTGSAGHAILKAWLEDGAPEPTASDPRVTKLETWPPRRVMVAGEKQQLVVRAHWSDGRVTDATPWATFDALNDAVAVVNPSGVVTALGPGEGHVMVRYAERATTIQVTQPYSTTPPATDGGLNARNNFVDDLLIAKWKDLGLTPSPPCDDATFLRRLYLDVIGTLPTPEEINAFLADRSPGKRNKAIDAVLARPEFVDFWTVKWGDLLRINRDALQEKGMWSFRNWVRANVRDGRPLDQFVKDILLAEGSTFTDGPANFYRVGRMPADWAETTAQVFLGVRLQCAKCHHHPFDDWSQDDYYGMAAFFARLTQKSSQEFGLFGRETVVHTRPTGEQTHPVKKSVVKPHPLGGPIMEDEFDRRRPLADWVVSKENPFFARNLANRFWGYLMGRGLVEPLDDLRPTNPACAPELLDALAKDLVAHDFDMKHLLRTILRSRAYQLDSVETPGNATDATDVYFTRYHARRLTAEQLADAVDFATGTRQKYTGLPAGTRAIQLPDPRVPSYLLDVFGRPQRAVVCECERTATPNIAQAMHLLNGDTLSKKIADPTGRIDQLLKTRPVVGTVIKEMYLVTLSRPPSPEETARAQQWLVQAGNLREGAQDLLWALLNSREFLFNH